MSESDPIDVAVGARMRLLRRDRGMSQSQLADALGLTFQQVQKYERGHNRISASKLLTAARVLGVQIAEMFGPEAEPGKPSETLDHVEAPLAAEVLHAWSRLPDDRLRRAALEVLRGLGEKNLDDRVKTASDLYPPES